MESPCRCGDNARWEETDNPTIQFDNGALQRVTYHYICFTCGWCWREHHHVERSYVDTSHHEADCW